MKMKIINILLAGLLVTSLVSCKDFLDVEPGNSGNSETSIQTPADAQVMINGLMRKMTDFDYYGRNFILYGDAKGGDLTIASQGRGNDALYTFNHSASSGSYSGFWNQIYHCILQANNLLAAIEALEAEGTEHDFSQYKGQALTARALMYFDLVRLYGKSYNDDKSAYGVPNITTPLDAASQPLRATVEENYQQIVADLQAAEELLPKTKANGYINYYGNLAIQARVYLYMEDYPAALAAAQEIINDSPYELYTNAQWVDSWGTQFGSESIFELGMFPSEGDLGTGSLGFYLRRQGHGGSTAMGWFMGSDYFLDRLGQDEDDVRWGVMSYDELGTDHLGAVYKYSGGVDLSGDGKATSTAVNIKVIRLSEIYLIAAEAAFHSDRALAATYLNEIRQRSPNLAPATAADISIDMILDERSKELFAEGHRFFDMIRLDRPITFNDDLAGIPVPHREKTIDRSFYKTILPISNAELNANPGLKAQQNPNY
jgi:tetratricopeptide (TPR) repeat protein